MSIPATGRVVRTSAGRDIVIERTFNAPIGDVWASIVEPERMSRWIGTWKGEAGVGNRVYFLMTAEGAVEPEAVLIHECDPPRHFLVDTDQGDASWRISVTLSEFDGVTTLVFTQAIKDGDDTGSHGPGWEYYLDRLVATHTGEPFADWDDYYPSQQKYWEDAALTEK